MVKYKDSGTGGRIGVGQDSVHRRARLSHVPVEDAATVCEPTSSCLVSTPSEDIGVVVRGQPCLRFGHSGPRPSASFRWHDGDAYDVEIVDYH